MEIRFEDHAAFQRAALWSAAGGAALGASGSLPLAAAGSAIALALGTTAVPWRWRFAAAGACIGGILAWALAPHPWSAPACGAMIGLLLAAARADALRRERAPPQSRFAVGLAVLGGAAALLAAGALLPDLVAALSRLIPPANAASGSGAILGLWISAASLPLHLRFASTPPADPRQPYAAWSTLPRWRTPGGRPSTSASATSAPSRSGTLPP